MGKICCIKIMPGLVVTIITIPIIVVINKIMHNGKENTIIITFRASNSNNMKGDNTIKGVDNIKVNSFSQIKIMV